jgi:hypothetical protein
MCASLLMDKQAVEKLIRNAIVVIELFSMEGPEGHLDEPEKLGMIPRAVFQIFETAEKLKEKNWKYVIEAQYLEIYNETIRDLLNTSEESKKLEIRHLGGKTIVTDSMTGNLVFIDNSSGNFARRCEYLVK